MKKIVFSLIACIAAFCVSAQSISLVSTGNSLTTDTVTNTAVKKLVTPLKGYKETVTVQVNLTKISGTLGGTVVPVVSNDGTTYYAVSGSSLSVTDVASQGIVWSLPQGYVYYGVQWTGTGTMSGSINAKLVARKTTD